MAQAISAQSTLKITLWNCKTDVADSSFLLNIYKDNSFFKAIDVTPKDGGYDDTSLYNLDKGAYTIESKSYFGDTFIDTVKVIKDSSYQVFICTDEIRDYTKAYKDIVDSLKKNNGITIEVASYGCFHHEFQKLRVFRKGNDYSAMLYPEIQQTERKIVKGSIKTKKLSETQLKLLYEFQLMSYMHASSFPISTEMTTCTFKYKTGLVKIFFGEDTKTIRNLFKKLIREIYGNKK